MCGRYALFGPESRLREHFALADCAAWAPRYNIAPQSDILVIRTHPSQGRVGVLHHWGLIPGWAKDPAIGARLSNARAETVAAKPAFRAALRRSRCLIPVNGFYEWRSAPAAKGPKQPYYFSSTAGDFLALAGLVECWPGNADDGASRILSVCIVTTTANAIVAPVHDRMPVVLDAAAQAEWLDPGQRDPQVLQRHQAPAPATTMQAWPVASRVNRAGNEGAELIAPVAA